MALGGRRSRGTVALAITASLGRRGTAAKPVGTVCFAWARAEGCQRDGPSLETAKRAQAVRGRALEGVETLIG